MAYEGNNVVQFTTPANNNSAPNAGSAPTGNVVYVNQYGQPIAPPQQTVYVNQYGQPVAPPTQTVTAQPQRPVQQRKPNPYWDNMDQNERNARACAVLFAIFSVLAVAIAIIIDELADGNVYTNDVLWIVYGEWNCGFTKINAEWLGIEVAAWPYSELCEEGAGDGIPIDAACEAKTGGILAMLCAIFSGLFIIAGIIYVQPKCEVKRKIPQCQRILFGIALILCALAPIFWTPMGEDLCAGEDYWQLKTGNSVYALIAACILIFITCLLAR